MFSHACWKLIYTRNQLSLIPQEQKNLVVKLALVYPDLYSRELAYKMTEEQQYSYQNQVFTES